MLILASKNTLNQLFGAYSSSVSLQYSFIEMGSGNANCPRKTTFRERTGALVMTDL
jgi:hypothetical protein